MKKRDNPEIIATQKKISQLETQKADCKKELVLWLIFSVVSSIVLPFLDFKSYLHSYYMKTDYTNFVFGFIFLLSAYGIINYLLKMKRLKKDISTLKKKVSNLR